MGVGGVRGGGKRGGAGGVGKAPRAGFDSRVDRAASTAGPSGTAGTSGAGALAPADALTSRALEIARLLRAGQISTRDEATRRLVSDILKQKLRMQSKALTQRIADALEDDPAMNRRLGRLWREG